MFENRYLDKTTQKTFMNSTPEHHAKLASIIQDARTKHKSLAVCWLELTNAYGSVHHLLIDFSLKHYHAPPISQAMVQSLCSNLSASVTASDWSTPTIPLQIGVYQGDPLSGVQYSDEHLGGLPQKSC